jgi:protein-S-isoprenylcysteine O-methyltransferase Ste14
LGVIYASVPPYWLLVHPLIGHWRRRQARLKHVGWLWFLLWIVIAAITWRWRHVALYTSWWAWIPAGVLIAIAYCVYGPGMKNFTNDQVIGRSEFEPDKHEQRLNTQGIRAHVRHPLYLGHFLHMAGWTVGTGLAVMYALLPFAVITGAWMVRYEERELVKRFGDAYREYQRNVPAIFPRLSR